MTYLIYALGFIFILGSAVVLHEFGHFIVAKLFKIRVETFSVGFGPRLFGKKWGHTDYRVSAIPLGGYVKLGGDESNAPLEGESAQDIPPEEMYNLRPQMAANHGCTRGPDHERSHRNGDPICGCVYVRSSRNTIAGCLLRSKRWRRRSSRSPARRSHHLVQRHRESELGRYQWRRTAFAGSSFAGRRESKRPGSLADNHADHAHGEWRSSRYSGFHS